MATIAHPAFGIIGMTPSEDGATFNPMLWLACPGNEKRARGLFRRKAARYVNKKTGRGLVDGLTGRELASRLDDAADMGMYQFMTRDYAKAGITEDEVGKALFQAAAYCDRAGWREGRGHRQDVRKAYPYVSSMAAGGDNPATVVATAERADRLRMMDAAQAREALQGAGREEKVTDDKCTAVYYVDGGTCRGETDGKLVATEARTTWVETPSGEYRFSKRTLPTGWRMDRRRGRPATYAPCVVPDAADCDDTPRYARQPLALQGVPASPGDGTEFRPAPAEWQEVEPRHYVRLRG